MLLFPTGNGGGGLIATVSASVGSDAGLSPGGQCRGRGQNRQVPVARMPIVLFIWGPGRILPVAGDLAVDHRKGSTTPPSNHTHAKRQSASRSSPPRIWRRCTDTIAKVARAAYDYTQALREGLAVANLAQRRRVDIGMLPI